MDPDNLFLSVASAERQPFFYRFAVYYDNDMEREDPFELCEHPEDHHCRNLAIADVNDHLTYFGVKADDLIDKLIAATRAEVDMRQTSRDEQERQVIAEQIAIGALRYFMLKFTRNSFIAFDFKDALSFEGETGPYIQYAVVRARNIFRKGSITPEAVLREFAGSDPGAFLMGDIGDDIWSLWLSAGRRSAVLDQCIATSEPAYLAKHAFQLAQEFNNFYHKHHVLTEIDPERRMFLLATAAITMRELITVLDMLGIESPEAM